MAVCLITALNSARAEAPPTPVIEMSIRADGSVLLEGKRYTDTAQLKSALVEIAHRQPTPSLAFRAHRKTKYEAISGPITMAQEAGLKIMMVGFIE